MYIIVEYWTNNLHDETSEYYEFKNTDQSNSYGRIIVKKKNTKNGFRQQNEMFLMLDKLLNIINKRSTSRDSYMTISNYTIRYWLYTVVSICRVLICLANNNTSSNIKGICNILFGFLFLKW